MAVDYQDAKVEHLSELKLAKQYDDIMDGCFIDSQGRRHDHSCCPDCCGCEDEYSRYMTLEEWMEN